jgi:hypothetical protein
MVRCQCEPDQRDEELATALAENIDEDGNDVGLVALVAAWTPAQRQRSEENLRTWVSAARRAMKPTGDEHDH